MRSSIISMYVHHLSLLMFTPHLNHHGTDYSCAMRVTQENFANT